MFRRLDRTPNLAALATTATLAVLLAGLLAGCAPEPEPTARFDHGVASGDPTGHSVILWTRAVPIDDQDPTATLAVDWVIATDEELQQVVASGSATAAPGSDYTVKIDATGLEAGNSYYYRFEVGPTSSPVGRTRTLPEGPTDHLRLAVFSCSLYPGGYFNAYNAAARQDDIDLVLHLGDYIYEYGRSGYGGEIGRRLAREVDPPHEILTLADYRTRYAQYRLDPDLQELHRRYPFIVVWDDHETANNSWREGAQNHNEGEGPWETRKREAIQAYYEWLPIRPPASEDLAETYRSFELGDLASLIMLDTRIIGRDEQIEYTDFLDWETVTERQARAFEAGILAAEERTILGLPQEAWLRDQLRQSTERGVPWQIIGQQLLVSPVQTPDLTAALPLATSPVSEGRSARLLKMAELELPLNLDAWDGYAAARGRLIDDLREFGQNTVILSGDTHNSWAFNLEGDDGETYAVELGVTSVTAPGFGISVPVPQEMMVAAFLASNPHLAWTNNVDRGYLLVDITPDEVVASWHFVDTIMSRDYEQHCAQSVRIEATPGSDTGRIEIIDCPGN